MCVWGFLKDVKRPPDGNEPSRWKLTKEDKKVARSLGPKKDVRTQDVWDAEELGGLAS